MNIDMAMELLRRTGALLEGHFLLTSGNHSERYIQCALLCSYPELAENYMEDIANHFREEDIDTVVAPAVGGIIVAYDVGRLLGKRALFFERDEGVMRLRRGFGIERGEKVLIVEDVITTGGSVLEVKEAVEKSGGEAKAVASLVNRSSGRFKPGIPYYYCVEVEIPIYKPEECPLCEKGIPVAKPGSRGLG